MQLTASFEMVKQPGGTQIRAEYFNTPLKLHSVMLKLYEKNAIEHSRFTYFYLRHTYIEENYPICGPSGNSTIDDKH